LKIVSLPFIMQRVACLVLALAPAVLAAQEAAGTQLWRLVAGTLPTPPALATGGAAGWWTPAQAEGASLLALELVQTSATARAAGFVAAARLRVSARQRVGLAYGRVGVSDLVRTSLSPDPDGGGIEYYTHSARALWAGEIGGATLGVAVAWHETRLDDARRARWTLDLGVRRGLGDRVVLAAATHFLGRVASDPAQDLYAAAQVRLWRGELWRGSGRAVVHARYGVAFGNGFEADHQFGAGLEVGGAFAADVLLAREGGYGVPTWRPIAGVQLRIGRYRVVFSGDAGPRSVGAAYRVGLEARLRR
jgi:hypothetical protein